MKVDSYDSLTQNFDIHNFIILINLVLNKDQNHYNHNTFLEKYSYQLAKN